MAIKPRYHLQPESNWMNDPNGPCFIGGLFHMFYQHNPHEAVWGNMTWGHAAGPDMVHWQRMPHALHPDRPYDKGGVFSGCCVVREGAPHILYTGVFPETLCLAVGDARGEVFEKHKGNPILTRGDRELAGWRDPYVWRQGDDYYMLIGSGDAAGGFAESYRSRDLINWEHARLFAHSKDYALDDEMWECPILMFNDAADAHDEGEAEAALIISATPHAVTRLIAGRLRGRQFDGASAGALDMGDCLYAPNMVRHPDGRWILFGWQRETGDPVLRAAQGWQGMLTLPRELRLEGGVLYTSPAREVNLLRGKRLAHYTYLESSSADAISAPHYEIEAEVRACGGDAIFRFLCGGAAGGGRGASTAGGASGGSGAGTTVGAPGAPAAVDASVSLTVSDGHVALQNGYAPLSVKNPIRFDIEKKDMHHIRVFVDGTSIEIYIDNRYALTTRAYPPSPGTAPPAPQLRVSAERGCSINALDVYAMNDCYINTQ